MSVYTKVTESELATWLKRYEVGAVLELKGIAAGIENTNYFVTTTRGPYVLTLFERLAADSLPFYLNLMMHLAQREIPCPLPITDRQGALMSSFNGKPSALFTRLRGSTLTRPELHHCAAVGDVLGRMHLAGRDYAAQLENPRGPKWWRMAAAKVLPFLDDSARELLQTELAFQAQHRNTTLPRGAIHADLFRDNVLFENDTLTGALDFYFGCTDIWLFDVAVTLNDWCVQADGRIDTMRAQSFLQAYRTQRPFNEEEHAAWPIMLRAAALRFWLSRLFDFHLPRDGELVHAHDPEHFHRILQWRIAEPASVPLG